MDHYKNAYDALTGLYNRTYFEQQLRYCLDNYQNNSNSFSVLLIDIANFKSINNSYGGVVGDMVIKNIANIITGILRKFDIVARVGSDQFAVILINIYPNHVPMLAEKIRSKIAQAPFYDMNGDTFYVSVSVGATNCNKALVTTKDLMKDLDVALYNSKTSGSNIIGFSDQIKDPNSKEKINYLDLVKFAIEKDKIIPYFQPIINNNTMEVYAYEVLSRIIDQQGNIIAAKEFIDCVEQSALSNKFHKTIFAKALVVFKKHIQTEQKPIKLFFNISVLEIQNNKILVDLNQICQYLKVNPNLITIEFIERNMIDDLYTMRNEMNKARQQGFTFAIDDFGTAYNSLHYLKEMKFEYLKIDGSFVKNILRSNTDYVLIKHIQSLCSELGITAIAEFVESKEILEKLQAINVKYTQGYFLGKPIDLTKNN